MWQDNACLSPSSQWSDYWNCGPSSRAGDCQRLHPHADKTSQLYRIARTNHLERIVQNLFQRGGGNHSIRAKNHSKLGISKRSAQEFIWKSFKTETLFPVTSSFKIYFLPGQFSGAFFQILPVTHWLVLKSFTLDKVICLYTKGLCCPDRGGEALVSLLPIWLCTHSAIGAINRPEQLRPVAPQEEAEDFRATDSGVRFEFLTWLLLPLEVNFTYLFICCCKNYTEHLLHKL